MRRGTCVPLLFWLAVPICLLAAPPARALSPGSPGGIDSLRELVRAQGVSGREEPVRRVILTRLPTGLPAEIDPLGNLVVTLGSGTPVRLLLARLDEPGYVVTRIQEDGYLRVQRLNRLPLPLLYDQFSQGQPAWIGTDSPDRYLSGVFAVLSTHLQRGRRPPAEPPPPPTPEELVLDVGARSAAEAEAYGARLLAPVTLEKELAILAGGRVSGPSLQGRLGCQVLLDLARRLTPDRFKGQVILAWAAQSWVGFRGAQGLARRFSPDEVMVFSSYAPDPPGLPVRSSSGDLGRGPLLGRSGEGGSPLTVPLERRLSNAARRARIRIQLGSYGVLHEGKPFSGGAVGVVGVPVRFPGTAVEMSDLDDFRSLVAWVQAYLEGSS